MPLIAPVVDIVALYGLLVLGLLVLDPVYAPRLDHEPIGPLWALPIQQFVNRQLMYLVAIQALTTAVLGARLHWQPIRRTGTFTDAPVPAEMSPR